MASTRRRTQRSRATAGLETAQAVRMSMVKAGPVGLIPWARLQLSGLLHVLPVQPQSSQQQEGAASRATAATDGYQLFQKQPCSDHVSSKCVRSVCVRACACVCCVSLSPGKVCGCLRTSSEEWLGVTAPGWTGSHAPAEHQKESSGGRRGWTEGGHRNAPGALSPVCLNTCQL